MDAPSDRSPHPMPRAADLAQLLSRKIVGQADALQYITPYVQMYQAGLSTPGRPAGIFLLLGPTGTGKTRTVEAIAEVLHGSAKLLKVDCAEYQSDHEVAKLIGAPPGYLGHRETKPLLSHERLSGVVSESCDLAIVLFDEIEKAAPAFTTLLLGLLDKGTLRLGDNSSVNFEKTLIFLTSNLGAREMLKEVQPDIGFQRADVRSAADVAGRLEGIGLAAVRRRFSPEFVNRLDAVITYRPLDAESLEKILDSHIAELQQHVHTRLGERSFDIDVTQAARQLLLERGASPEYGARELKRTIHRMLTQPLAAVVAGGQVEPGRRVMVDVADPGGALKLRFDDRAAASQTRPAAPAVLILDDNPELVELLEHGLVQTGVTAIAAMTAAEARQIADRHTIDLALVDLILPDGDGLSVAFEFLRRWPKVRVIVMTGSTLSADEIAVCERQDFPVLRKPFLVNEAVVLVKSIVLRSAAPAL
jgi:ATP-dependent Clp protease ATP-binding subunit ClpA